MNDIIGIIVVLLFFYIVYTIIKAIFNSIINLFKGKLSEKSTVPDIDIRVTYSSGIESSDDDYSNEYNIGGNKHDKNAEDSWVTNGEAVEFKGYNIPGGLLYIGTKLTDGKGWGTEPALLNPKLPIIKTSANNGDGMEYWPSYSKIPSHCRGGYLDWLATGRSNPSAYIGYVFLFYYGLERRALLDTQYLTDAKDDIPHIREEIRRLLSIYSNNRSFWNYATQFLGVLDLKLDGVKTDYPPKYIHTTQNITIPLAAGLGKLVRDGIPINSIWALAWAWHDPEIRISTPMMRCSEEFNKLFTLAFKSKFPNGLKLTPNKTKLIQQYRPASGGLELYEEPLLVNGESIPNVTVLRRPKTLLTELVESSAAQLDAYSRFVGRNSDEKDSLTAIALLPPYLLRESKHPALRAIVSLLHDSFNGTSYGRIPGNKLYEQWITKHPGKMSKREAVTLTQLLESLGYGMEPDPRFGKITITPETTAIVFSLPINSPVSPTPEYNAACNLLHLAALVSTADGIVSSEEEERLEQQLEAQMGLSPEERVRLRAHMYFLLENHTQMSGMKKRVEHITNNQKHAITNFLIDVAMADGYVDPNEVKVLEKIYKALGLNNDELYGHIHHASVTDVTIMAKETSAYTSSMGRPAIDQVVLAQKLKETEEVTTILSHIMGDYEEMSSQNDVTVNKYVAKGISGLDTQQSVLLITLGRRNIWKKTQLELLADRLGILLDGAIDSINELAFDKFDAPLIEEDGENYIIDIDTFKELRVG